MNNSTPSMIRFPVLSLLLAAAWLAGVAPAPGLAQTAVETYLARLEQATGTQGSVIRGEGDWLFFAPEVRHLAAGAFWGDNAVTASRATRDDAKDPLPAILAFHRALQAEGVRLILVPVPAKATIYPEQLSPDLRADPRTDEAHLAFFDLLRAEGVEVIDLTERFLAGRGDERGPMYCRQDTHWSGLATVLAADAIAARLQRPKANGLDLEATWNTVDVRGDLWRMLEDETLPRESVPLRFVTARGEPVPPDPESPLILLGDSHNLVFHAGDDMHARGAGLADQLAYVLGLPVELIAVRGSGATPARINLFRRAQRDPDYWSGKEAVVWVFSVREFTETDGWRIVPIKRD